MRHDKITAASMRLRPCVYICCGCDTPEHTLTEQLPHGWHLEFIDGQALAFCDSCKIDAADEHTACPLATRLGVASQLDAIEPLEWDEEDRRHGQRIVAIAQAERIGRAVLPVLCCVIAVGLASSMIAQAWKWAAF